MATIILSILIFGTAGIITYRRIKKGESCEDCQTACPVKKEQSSQEQQLKKIPSCINNSGVLQY